MDAWSYIELSKPKLVFLLVITSLCAIYVALIKTGIPLARAREKVIQADRIERLSQVPSCMLACAKGLCP